MKLYSNTNSFYFLEQPLSYLSLSLRRYGKSVQTKLQVDPFAMPEETNKDTSNGNQNPKNVRIKRGRWKSNYKRKTKEQTDAENGNLFSFIDIDKEPADGDKVNELHNYCIQNDIPLPSIKMVQLAGTAEFVAHCTVANIKCFGMSNNKPDACQHAAMRMLSAFANGAVISNKEKQLHRLLSKGVQIMSKEDQIAERRRQFQIYRELTGGDVKKRIFDIRQRHNCLKNLSADIKLAALAVLDAKEFISTETQLLAALEALKLTLRTSEVDSTSDEQILMLEVECVYTACFMGLESEVHQQVIDYLRIMLV